MAIGFRPDRQHGSDMGPDLFNEIAELVSLVTAMDHETFPGLELSGVAEDMELKLLTEIHSHNLINQVCAFGRRDVAGDKHAKRTFRGGLLRLHGHLFEGSPVWDDAEIHI